MIKHHLEKQLDARATREGTYTDTQHVFFVQFANAEDSRRHKMTSGSSIRFNPHLNEDSGKPPSKLTLCVSPRTGGRIGGASKDSSNLRLSPEVNNGLKIRNKQQLRSAYFAMM